MPKATRSSLASSRNDQEEGNYDLMSPHQNMEYHPYAGGRENIVVHDHDVLNGRGVNMAHHKGNQRFRSLVQSRSDPKYCTSYSLDEKKVLAEEIVRHIEELDPPGRFLKRCGKTKNKRGLSGPWEVMSREEAIKKARQALRDCNRPDREGYAKCVAAPTDVVESAKQRQSTGLSQKEYVKQLVVATNPSSSNSAPSSGRTTPNTPFHKRASERSQTVPVVTASVTASATKSSNNHSAPHFAASWMPDKNFASSSLDLDPNDSLDTQTTPVLRNSTPTTAATSVGFFSGDTEDFDVPFNDDHDHHHHLRHHNPHGVIGVAPRLDSPTHTSHFDHGLSSSPAAHGDFDAGFAASFQDDDVKPRAVSSFHDDSEVDPLQEEADAAALANTFDDDFVRAFEGDPKHLF